MTDELWQAFVQITGTVNALLLGVVLIVSPRLHRTRSRRKLGLAFLAYGYLLLSFTLVDNFWVSPAWWIWLSDYVIALLASALFFDYMSDALGRKKISRLFYLPPFLFLILAAALGIDFIAGPAINLATLLQIAYSCLTTWIFVASSRDLASRPRHLLVLLIGLWTLHAFQLGRMVLPHVGWLFDAVPLVGTALILTLTALVLTDSRTLRRFSQVTPDPGSPSITGTAIDLYMTTERPHLEPGLTLEQLASALGVSRSELSRLVGTLPYGNFYGLVNHYRVQEAKRLLADPAEQRTSIEAIGLMAGFRARSTFYEAFRRDTEKTPAQFREDLG